MRTPNEVVSVRHHRATHIYTEYIPKRAARNWGSGWAPIVLDKLGELIEYRGTRLTARKVTPVNTSLSAAEETFITEAIKSIIRRLAEFDPQRPPPVLVLPRL